MIMLTLRTPTIFEEAEEVPEAEEEDKYDDDRYTGDEYGDARMDNNPFSEVNDLFGKFAKQFKSCLLYTSNRS